jgi:hypothetical protein
MWELSALDTPFKFHQTPFEFQKLLQNFTLKILFRKATFLCTFIVQNLHYLLISCRKAALLLLFDKILCLYFHLML